MNKTIKTFFINLTLLASTMSLLFFLLLIPYLSCYPFYDTTSIGINPTCKNGAIPYTYYRMIND